MKKMWKFRHNATDILNRRDLDCKQASQTYSMPLKLQFCNIFADKNYYIKQPDQLHK